MRIHNNIPLKNFRETLYHTACYVSMLYLPKQRKRAPITFSIFNDISQTL